MQDTGASFLPDSNQLSLAADLGIGLQAEASLDSLILEIEQSLGDKSIEEQARWFVLSVLRHLNREKWLEPTASNLDMSRQYALARDCLAIDGFKKSMKVLLKNRHCVFTLLRFRASKDVKNKIMSTATNAYKIAATVLQEASTGLDSERETEKASPQALAESSLNKNLTNIAATVLPEADTGLAPERETEKASPQALAEGSLNKNLTNMAATVLPEADTGLAPEHETKKASPQALTKGSLNKNLANMAANRRAGRRGYSDAGLHSAIGSYRPEKSTSSKDRASSMSEEEFSRLETAIANSSQEPVQQEWNYRFNEDRWSLILGLAAGVGFFSLVFILFL